MGSVVADRSALIDREDDLSDDLRARVKGELAPGERLLWAGRPAREGVDGHSFWFWVIWYPALWSIIFAGLALSDETAPDAKFYGIGKAMTIVGFGAVFFGTIAPFLAIKERWDERRKRARMSYALSDRRAICWVPCVMPRGVKVLTIPYHSIGSVHRVEMNDGSGSVRFAGNIPNAEFAGFEGVADVRRIEGFARDILVDPDFRDFSDPADSEEDA